MDKVLIVEDNPVFSKIIARKVNSQLGFEYDIAPTLKDVESLLKNSNQYFAAVLDLNLPDAKVDRIVDFVLSYKIPSIIFTGDFNEKMREQMLSKNIVDYVIKESVQDIDYVIRTIHRIYKNQFIKVMVVDDSKILRKFIVRLLKIHQYIVFDAENGKEALKILNQNPDIKLIITDYQMPDMNGFELVTNIRKTYSMNELAIIGISAHGSGLLSAKFLKKGANDFVNKPFVNEELNCRISQNIEMLEHIEAVKAASSTDYLTGLNNRRQFFNLGNIIFKSAQRGKLVIAVAMIDIDHFKKVNDTHGHLVGDIALKHVSYILQNNLRESDIISRYGGEEFCVLCPYTNEIKVKTTFERIRKKIEAEKIKIKSIEISVTVSIGICTQIKDSLYSTINKADDLLYQAKKSGRNQIITE